MACLPYQGQTMPCWLRARRGSHLTLQAAGRPFLLSEEPAVPVVSRGMRFAPGRSCDKFPGGRRCETRSSFYIKMADPEKETGQMLAGWKLRQRVGWMVRSRGQRCRPELGAAGMASLCLGGSYLPVHCRVPGPLRGSLHTQGC